MPDRSLLNDLLADLAAEGAALDAVVAELEDTAWLGPTPAEGWTVAHQIAHLNWTDEVALVAAAEPDAFAAEVDRALAAPRDLSRRRGGRRGRHRPDAPGTARGVAGRTGPG